MIDRICSDNYKKFIRGISSDNCTISAIADYTRSSMPIIKDSINIGRLEAIIDAKPNEIDRTGYSGQEMLFQSPDGYEPLLYRMDFKTGSGVSITMNAYPKKGYEWNEEERDDIYFLCSNFFALYERARLINVMKKAAFIESQTGALNLNGVMNASFRLSAQSRLGEFTVAFINIKNFKLINQQIGMRQSDNILRVFVDDIHSFKLPEELIGRLGGDNFVIVMKDERINEYIEHLSPLHLNFFEQGNKHELDLFFRMGLFDMEDGNSMGEAIANASTALGVTRKDGNHDIIWFDHDMRIETLSEQQTSYAFNQALLNKEFVVYYQPKVDLLNNSLCGSEALVRWNKDGKLLSPASFIPALERDGSICELDFYVFENVCKDIRNWIDTGVDPVAVSVNFSKNHLRRDDFSERVLAILDRYHVKPEYIEVELTETACYEDYNRLKGFLEEMKKHKIKVSIDDFGTGYSSLSLLKDLKVDVIKLDQSFIKSLDEGGDNSSSEVVIKNIIHMVYELSMKIIAEGVETNEEAEFFKGVSCNMAQGYLYDKPMSQVDFEVLLKGSREYNK